MRSGRLRHRVELQSATEARDSHGQPVKTWSTQAVVWAGVEPIKGREGIVAMQVAATATIRVVIRYRAGVTTDWRVKFGMRTMKITSIVDTDERHHSLEFMCSEIT